MKENISQITPKGRAMLRVSVIWVIIIILMTLFFYSGLDKALNFERFQSGLTNSPLIPDGYAKLAGLLVTAILLVTSSFMLLGFWFPKFMKIGLYTLLITMIMFTIFIILILTIADYVPCICIGLSDNLGLNWKQHLYLNITIMLIAGLALWLYIVEANKLSITSNRAKPEALKKTGIYKKKGGIGPC